MTENIVDGQYFRILRNKANEEWDRLSFWTKAKDVQVDNLQLTNGRSKDLETVLQDMKTDVQETENGIRADLNALQQQIVNINTNISFPKVKKTEKIGRINYMGGTGSNQLTFPIEYLTTLENGQEVIMGERTMYVLLVRSTDYLFPPIYLSPEFLLDSSILQVDNINCGTNMLVNYSIRNSHIVQLGEFYTMTADLTITVIENAVIDIFKMYL